MLNRSFWSVIIFTSIVVAFVACSGNMNEDSSSNKDTDDEQIIIKYGHGFMTETPHHQAAERFKERIETRTDGQIIVEIYPADQLGVVHQQFEQLKSGEQEVALLPAARLSEIVPELQLFDLPYLFPDRETAYELMDGDFGQELLEFLEKENVRGIAFYEDGFKQFTSNHALKTPEDFHGLNFRTMESEIIMEQFRSLGADSTQIDIGDLYVSLENKAVDGQENPLVTITNMKLYDVQDVVTISDHGYLGHVLMYSNEWFMTLPEDMQRKFIEVGQDLANWQRKQVQEEERYYMEVIEKSGTEIVKLTEEQKDVLKEATSEAHEMYRSEVNEVILEKAYEEIEQIILLKN